jgi:RNase P subunit RPR2
MLRFLFRLLFGCGHKRTTFPLKRDGQTRVTCLDCGEELVYDWNKMEIEDRRKAERITGHGGDRR